MAKEAEVEGEFEVDGTSWVESSLRFLLVVGSLVSSRSVVGPVVLETLVGLAEVVVAILVGEEEDDNDDDEDDGCCCCCCFGIGFEVVEGDDRFIDCDGIEDEGAAV